METFDKIGKTLVPITLPITNTQLINTGSEPIIVFKKKTEAYPTDK